jgi:hypothetical protein
MTRTRRPRAASAKSPVQPNSTSSRPAARARSMRPRKSGGIHAWRDLREEVEAHARPIAGAGKAALRRAVETDDAGGVDPDCPERQRVLGFAPGQHVARHIARGDQDGVRRGRRIGVPRDQIEIPPRRRIPEDPLATQTGEGPGATGRQDFGNFRDEVSVLEQADAVACSAAGLPDQIGPAAVGEEDACIGRKQGDCTWHVVDGTDEPSDIAERTARCGHAVSHVVP